MEKFMTLKFKGFMYTEPTKYKDSMEWKCIEKLTKKCPAILKTNITMYTNQRRFNRHNHPMSYPYGKCDWIYLYVKCVLFMYKTQFLLRLYVIKIKELFFRNLFVYVCIVYCFIKRLHIKVS